mmetsp:Transcript_4203/g.7018  ORF Transcript_4203/g.7018 Transcript_4203/m.7018 type:complete len:250 (+) Transcript_4203:60-809(+)
MTNTGISHQHKKKRYLTLRSFLSEDEQEAVKEEALQCHSMHSTPTTESFEPLASATCSLKLKLNIACGASLEDRLPLAVRLCRRAFAEAQDVLHDDALAPLAAAASGGEDMTGLALLYGPHGSMTSHYDAPTQPGQRHEWLAMLTIGNDVEFNANDELLTLRSGDALVMDSMAVLHGVKGIIASRDKLTSSRISLPVEGSRLGILMWRARSVAMQRSAPGDDDDVIVDLEGVNMLFPDSSSDDDDDHAN